MAEEHAASREHQVQRQAQIRKRVQAIGHAGGKFGVELSQSRAEVVAEQEQAVQKRRQLERHKREAKWAREEAERRRYTCVY